MTEAEALEAVFGANEAMQNAFQYWLSVTFAIILTAYFGRRHLNRSILITIGLLYLATAVLFFVDYLHWLAIMRLIEYPLAGEHWPYYGPIKSSTRTGLFLIGTITAEYYLFYSYAQRNNA
jgi:hypothetical protein